MLIILIYTNGMNSKRHSPPNCDAAVGSVPPRSASCSDAAQASVTRMPSHALFLGASEVEIEHHGLLYRLRQTSLGKLILTK